MKRWPVVWLGEKYARMRLCCTCRRGSHGSHNVRAATTSG